MISIEKIPTTMQALVLHDIADLRLENVKVENIDKDSVLLHIKYCGICSSDIPRIYTTGTYHFPTIPGHEFSGEIVAVDEDDKELLGKKASVFPLLPCKECEACLAQEYAQCANYNYFGSRCDGGFSEYLVVPKWNLTYCDTIDYDVAALCEPTAVSLHAVRKAQLQKDDKVLVMGSGTIGLLTAMIAKSYGSEVYVGARRKEAFDYLESLGLNYIDTNNLEQELKNKIGKQGFNCVFEAIGSNKSISDSITAGGNFAKIVLVGNPSDDLQVDKNTYWKILRKEMKLIGTWNSSYGERKNDWQAAIKFIQSNQTKLKSLITATYYLDEYEQAFGLLKDARKHKVKVMLRTRGRS